MARRCLAIIVWCLLASQAWAVDTVVTICASGCTQTAGTWTVPSDWSSTNSIVCVGASAGSPGATTFGGGTTPGGAGAGALAKISNVSAATLGGIGNSITVGVGVGGTAGAGGGATVASGAGGNGGDTYFNASSLANAVTQGNTKACGAQGGQASATVTGGLGGSGSGAVSTGTTINAGGKGGPSANFNPVGAGGGGAGGLQGVGGDGGAGAGGGFGGSGGGGSGGGGSGTVGANGVQATGTGGAAGGNNAAGVGAGAGVAADTAANPGTIGGGGSGAGVNTTGTPRTGGAGGAGNDLGAGKGVGGGGGAGGAATGANVGGNGGAGGNYGGAPGGGSISTGGGSTAGNGVGGTPGIVVITYTPSAASIAKNSMMMGISYDPSETPPFDPIALRFHGSAPTTGTIPAVSAATFYTYSPATNTQAVGTLTAKCGGEACSGSDTITGWSITAGNGAGDFVISAGGAITVTSQGATDLPGTTLEVAYTLTVTATNAAGTSSGQTVPITVYADGFAGAPSASVQSASLLNTYHANGISDSRAKGNGYQPQWNVAGVDYAVGYPTATSLTDWQSVSGTGITVSIPNATVTYGATSNCTANAIDFSLHNGAQLVFNGCSAPTATNNNFLCGSGCIAHVSAGVISVLAGTGGSINISNNVIDGGSQNSPNEATLVYYAGGGSSVTFTFQYNWMKNYSQQVLELVNGSSLTMNYRYNLIGNGAFASGSHLNYQQLGAGPYTITTNFNTSSQAPQVSSGEGYQWYNGVSGTAALTNPKLQYNTMIATAAGAMSYMVHGNCHVAADCGSTQSVITGTGAADHNFADTTGASGVFYPSTGSNMWANWTFSNNTNMKTGAAITNAP